MKKVAHMETPTGVNKTVDIQSLFFSQAARMLACNSIPTTYEGSGVCGIVFGENARNLPESGMKKGLILDIDAAEILSSRGIDVGLENINGILNDTSGSIVAGMEEHFLNNDNYISIIGACSYDITVKKSVEVLSDIETKNGNIPLSYRYENADGNRFLVLNVNPAHDESAMLKHYARGRQISDNVLWLSGEKLPAYVYGNPSLYVQCKQNKNSMAVGLWNFCADSVDEPIIYPENGVNVQVISTIGCKAEVEDGVIKLSRIEPYGFAAVEYEEK
jgi:hypothetical protein